MKRFNYVRLRGDHATFDGDTESARAFYDPARAEAMFGARSKGNYNTVRVFIIGRSKANPGSAGNFETTKEPYEPYMENVLDFLRRATRHGIRVFPAFGDGSLPLNAYYRHRVRGGGHHKNVLILTKEGVDNMVRVRDLALEAGINGMLFWTYDCFEQARLYHAASDWRLFVEKMCDSEKPGDETSEESK